MDKIELIPQIAIDEGWTSSEGIGTYIAGTGPKTGSLARGGHYNTGGAGIFAATFNRNGSNSYQSVGFRCTYSPKR